MPCLKIGLCQALTQDVRDALASSGVRNVDEFIAADLESLTKACNVPYKDLVSIRRVLLAQFSAFPVNGNQLYEEVLTSTSILNTGCAAIDALLDGGLYSGEVTEITGASAAGKTQFCMSTCLSVAHKIQASVMYVDTSGGFDIDRLHGIMAAMDMDNSVAERVTDRIQCQRVFDMFELIDFMEKLTVKQTHVNAASSTEQKLKLLVVDSIPAVVLPLLGGNQQHGFGLVQQLASCLKNFAQDFSCAVLVTNNVVQHHGSQRPSLGKVWLGVPHIRILMEKTTSAKGRASIMASSRHTVGKSVQFEINEMGFV